MIAEKEDIKVAAENRLFPIFLKLEELSLLIIGGGNVAFEKLNAVLNNSPQTKIKLVGIEINNAIKPWLKEPITWSYPNALILPAILSRQIL